MSKKELANHFGICASTLNEWFKRAGLDIPKNIKILTPAQVKSVFEKIGE